MTRIAGAIAILVLLLALAYALVFMGISGPPTPTHLRKLGETYLRSMLDGNETKLLAGSPEAVSAILWDYRGLDTLYETIVMMAAIIGAAMVYSEFMHGSYKKIGGRIYEHGLSIIVRAVSKIIVWLTLIASLTIGFTGQLTPGGGFIGGAAFAVVPVLVILVFYPGLLERIGLTRRNALLMRTIALISIIAVIILPLLYGGYIFQNMPKPGAETSIYPERFIDETPLGGTILILNIIEMFAVAGAFILSFLIIGYLAHGERLRGED